jgi:hypothetical protein
MPEKTKAEEQGQAQYHCPCGEDFQTAEALKQHAAEHHANKPAA